MSLRMMAVHAHPDDESSKGAATNAHYIRAGAEVMVVSCTGGELGDVLNEQLPERAMAERDLTGLRRRELQRAQQITGFQHRWLGYRDSGMRREDGTVPAGSFASIPVEVSAEHLVRLIREFRPQVLVTYNEQGGYPHPDHIRTHEISMHAYEAAADPDAYPGTGEPWSISKVYYEALFNVRRMSAVQAIVAERYPDSELHKKFDELMEWIRLRPDTATTHVLTGDFFALRDEALRAHASQVAPDSDFFFWPIPLQQEAWPYEDYQLAASRIATSLPEADLFAGIETSTP